MSTIVILFFVAVDTALYSIAKYPERSRHWYSFLPGGGIAVLMKYGRNSQ